MKLQDGVYTADFETTGEQNYVKDGFVRVWLWSLVRINDNQQWYGNNIESFFKQITELKCKKIWFHNLAFDGQFILYHLLMNGKKCGTDFDVLIDEMNVWYQITLNDTGTKIWDSLKKFPGQSVENVQKMYGIPGKKDKPDFNRYIPQDYTPTKKEIDYCVQDSRVMQYAMYEEYKQGHNSMTLSSDQFNQVKQTLGGFRQWRYSFPEIDLETYREILPTYKGGWVYLNPKFQEKDLSHVFVYDVNSLYPHVMRNCWLPHGKPWKSFVKPNGDLYIVCMTCEFQLKGGYLPTIQIKHNQDYKSTEYLTCSKGPVKLSLTNIDCDLFFEHYDVKVIQVHYFLNFYARVGQLQPYIDFWTSVKIQAKKDKNDALYYISKRYLNSPYGKTGMKMERTRRIPELVDGEVEYDNQYETDEGVYIPYQTFVCQQQRYITITQAQKNYDNFIYADTDSIHLTQEAQGINIDDYKLGWWKHEGTFDRGKYLRPKTYIHAKQDKTVTEVKCQGMPDNVKMTVSYDGFRIGQEYGHKLMKRCCVGGCYLKDTTFKITQRVRGI